MTTRRSIPRLVDPAPDDTTLGRLLTAAVAAPDHGQLRPWRFVVIAGEGRRRLGEVFARAHAGREPAADAGALEKTAAKPLRAPLIVAVICTPVSAEKAWNGKDVPVWEQQAATAAAIQNLCLGAHAEGFGSMWRTGWYGQAPAVRQALGMATEDLLVGWVYLGTVPDGANIPPRREVPTDQLTSTWP